MIKTLIALATLTLLASCTMPGTQAPTPVAPVKQMTPDTMMPKTETMPKADTMMKDDKMMMSGSMDTTMMDNKKMDVDSMKKEEMMKPEAMIRPVDAMKDDKMMTAKSTGYMSYDASKVKEALASGQKVVLFFHAGWCPSCRALDASINGSLATIPADTLILRVDYDNSTELKKQYRVVTQHTTVTLSADGSTGVRQIGARTVAEVVN